MMIARSGVAASGDDFAVPQGRPDGPSLVVNGRRDSSFSTAGVAELLGLLRSRASSALIAHPQSKEVGWTTTT
jgi:hypothetical protein